MVVVVVVVIEIFANMPDELFPKSQMDMHTRPGRCVEVQIAIVDATLRYRCLVSDRGLYELIPDVTSTNKQCSHTSHSSRLGAVCQPLLPDLQLS